jgi:O-methyltransferase
MNGIRARLAHAGHLVLWAVWTRTPIGRTANAVIRRLPDRPSRWIARGKRRTREDAQRRSRLREGREPLVPERELEATYRDALKLLASEAGPDGVGDYLEFGVYVGTSLLCMHRASRAAGLDSLRLFGFDSFEGLPDAAATESEGVWKPGQFRADYDSVRKILARRGVDWSRTVLVPGWFEDTLHTDLARQLGIEKAGVVMIDCDIYSSARTALDFCVPLIGDEAVLIFDDWNSGGLASKGLGERRAFEELLAANPDLRAEELRPYSDNAKVFLVTRTRASLAPVAIWMYREFESLIDAMRNAGIDAAILQV